MREITTTIIIAFLLFFSGIFMIIKNTKMYEFDQEFRKYNPMAQLINPFGSASKKASKAVSVLIGVVMILTSLFLMALVLFRQH